MKASKLIELCYRLGLFDAIHALWPNRLTVLAYHRVIDPHPPGFDTFKPNVSATPAAFAAQMDFIRHRFHVVSINELVAWLQDKHPLPLNPALITFDDGYRDNLDYALPVLQERGLPAVIFLATNYIGSASPFFWDLIAYCFHHTSKNEVDLPLAGRQQWRDPSSRAAVMVRWLDSLKKLPDTEKWAAVEKLPQALDVSVSADAFANMHLTWDQVRQMVAAGVDMGAHTQSHPILTRVTLEQARDEVAGSKARIEVEINQPVTAFAYPNGQPSDFNPALQTMLQQVGIKAAFTLVPGPTRPTEVRQAPMAIRRIFIGYKDTLARFAAKVMGAPRLIGRLG
ncbi:MAG: polysaccharide deacetylase family protein [Chloroflexi bacterium]|nr:polysaccharide deacetylase family protein [Chloroflexota bacterium]